MSGVWVFDKNGVARLIQNPTKESFERKEPVQPGTATAPGARPRVLVFLPTNQVIRSYAELEQRLTELGWSRYHDNSSSSNRLLQFHKSEDSAHLISLPTNFANFSLLKERKKMGAKAEALSRDCYVMAWNKPRACTMYPAVIHIRDHYCGSEA
ncbi:hypothetical protein WN944_028076 [Citrus x changshan-huyou]|uniref:Flowering-promoting factor 1-like protein 1 n=1 Tax=Citrus x changshan-huyou TaxID=2935761 RepID=A0AAP0LIQ3_9ROSI